MDICYSNLCHNLNCVTPKLFLPVQTPSIKIVISNVTLFLLLEYAAPTVQVEVIEPPDCQWGNNANGTWTGIVSSVARGGYDCGGGGGDWGGGGGSCFGVGGGVVGVGKCGCDGDCSVGSGRNGDGGGFRAIWLVMLAVAAIVLVVFVVVVVVLLVVSWVVNVFVLC